MELKEIILGSTINSIDLRERAVANPGKKAWLRYIVYSNDKEVAFLALVSRLDKFNRFIPKLLSGIRHCETPIYFPVLSVHPTIPS